MKKISETETEWLFKDLLQENGYLDEQELIIEFKDATSCEKLKKLLSNASKIGSGRGIPDFIIRSKKYPDIVFLIEAKADINYHESPNRNKYKDYAVDGVLLYSSYVSKEYDVLSIALSGTKENCKVSSFWQLKGTDTIEKVKSGELLTYQNYLRLILDSDIAFNRDYTKLLSYAKLLNSNLHKKKIKESNRALLISGILVALQNKAFRISYNEHTTPTSMINSLLNAISSQLREDPKKDVNTDIVLGAFNFIKTNKTFTDRNNGLLALDDVISTIKENVYTFLDKYKYVDTLSQFYTEFLRYANTDKGLGIVLTPIHIARLFAKMANVNKDTVVVDNASGTGSFLVAAMGEMITDAGDDEGKINHIKEEQIYGIEYEDSIFALLVSNMIIHSDGRSNMIWGSTFDEIPQIMNKKKNLIIASGKSEKDISDEELRFCDVGLLNPPFKMDKDDIPEFDFILSNLMAIRKFGTVIALVPVSVVTDVKGINYEYKKRLLEKHTLEAVVSLPEELFNNSKTSVVTVGIVITAHQPHPKNKETWFGYWRNDGFIKTKKYGRADVNNEWDSKEELWLDAFMNRRIIDQFSVMKKVAAEDEWVAEAFLDPDYSKITKDDFEKTVREFLAFKMENEL